MKNNPALEVIIHSSSSNNQKNDVVTGKEAEYIESSIPFDNMEENTVLLCNNIDQITRHQKSYLKRALRDILHYSPDNAKQICGLFIL